MECLLCCNKSQAIFTPQKQQTMIGSLLLMEKTILILSQHSAFLQVSNCFSFLTVCNQGTSGGTVVRMFNYLLTEYSKSNRLVLQKNISRDSAIRNENIVIFLLLPCSCETSLHRSWSSSRLLLKFLSIIARCDGCGRQHFSRGTADLRYFTVCKQLYLRNKKTYT